MKIPLTAVILAYVCLMIPIYLGILMFEYLFPKTAWKWFSNVKIIPENLEHRSLDLTGF